MSAKLPVSGFLRCSGRSAGHPDFVRHSAHIHDQLAHILSLSLSMLAVPHTMRSLLRAARRMWPFPSAPRQFPTSNFEVIDSSRRIEEETLPWYNPLDFYPVKIGEVFQSRYQVTGKLGYGMNGTVWLCRDLVYAVPSPGV